VQVIQYPRENTTIPVPNIHFWGTTEDNPRQLASFIIMDFTEGARFSRFLRQPTDDEHELAVLKRT
jgi:hypothetical protein